MKAGSYKYRYKYKYQKNAKSSVKIKLVCKKVNFKLNRVVCTSHIFKQSEAVQPCLGSDSDLISATGHARLFTEK